MKRSTKQKQEFNVRVDGESELSPTLDGFISRAAGLYVCVLDNN